MVENLTTRWDKAVQETMGKDGTVYDDSPCIVILNNERIVVSYKCPIDNKTYEYSGENDGNGHYSLECEILTGHAHLHFHTDKKGHKCLIGEYTEDGTDGFWKIRLEGEKII